MHKELKRTPNSPSPAPTCYAVREPDLLLLRCEMTLLSIRAGKAMRTMHEALDQLASLQEQIEDARQKIDGTKTAYEKRYNEQGQARRDNPNV